jgi:hypothetical protein
MLKLHLKARSVHGFLKNPLSASHSSKRSIHLAAGLGSFDRRPKPWPPPAQMCLNQTQSFFNAKGAKVLAKAAEFPDFCDLCENLCALCVKTGPVFDDPLQCSAPNFQIAPPPKIAAAEVTRLQLHFAFHVSERASLRRLLQESRPGRSAEQQAIRRAEAAIAISKFFGGVTVCSFGGASILASRLVGSFAPPNCITTKSSFDLSA